MGRPCNRVYMHHAKTDLLRSRRSRCWSDLRPRERQRDARLASVGSVHACQSPKGFGASETLGNLRQCRVAKRTNTGPNKPALTWALRTRDILLPLVAPPGDVPAPCLLLLLLLLCCCPTRCCSRFIHAASKNVDRGRYPRPTSRRRRLCALVVRPAGASPFSVGSVRPKNNVEAGWLWKPMYMYM